MANPRNYTSFSKVYQSFASKITDDMYMEFSEGETARMMQDLLMTAIHKFEFPRNPFVYKLKHHEETDVDGHTYMEGAFRGRLTNEEINILATYMVVEWIGQQLASIEMTRMKYSGADFKFTSQANHMQKLLRLKRDYEREGFHLQRLYKRRFRDLNGVFHSTFGKIMEPEAPLPTEPSKHGPPMWDDGDDDSDWITDGMEWLPLDVADEEDEWW
jgi:hypothetical protein